MAEVERTKFEKYAEAFGLRLTRKDIQTDGVGKYLDPITHAAWSAWQARAALQPST